MEMRMILLIVIVVLNVASSALADFLNRDTQELLQKNSKLLTEINARVNNVEIAAARLEIQQRAH
jgi:hypothetical protein